MKRIQYKSNINWIIWKREWLSITRKRLNMILNTIQLQINLLVQLKKVSIFGLESDTNTNFVLWILVYNVYFIILTLYIQRWNS